ncbi:MAG TPA: biotin/lipoyl-containing protein [Candidatus Limnocylindrales bacterium]|nr:biotin/lipoyl-containing protein [Candidatus Limnocylindrales bacterium]
MTEHDEEVDPPIELDHEHDADGNVVPRPGLTNGDGGGVDPAGAAARPDLDPGDASLLALVDRLGSLLDRSELSELAVEAGGTRLVLRTPAAIATTVIAGPAWSGEPDAGAALAASATGGGSDASTVGSAQTGGRTEAPARPSVKAPLTGVWYSSPAPGSAPFVAVGREVAVGQVIGLIEAMKLFNEIKSDLAGRVVRVVPESGALVKAKQPLIEVEPL